MALRILFLLSIAVSSSNVSFGSCRGLFAVEKLNLDEIAESAKALRSSGDFDSALSLLQMGLRRDPYCLRLLKLQTRILIDSGRYEEAIESARRELNTETNYTPSTSLKREAFANLLLGNYERALSVAIRAHRLNRTSIGILSILMRASAALHRYEEALEFANTSLQLDRENIGALILKTRVLMALERWEEAFDSVQAQLKLKKDSIGALEAKITILTKLKAHEEAEIVARELLRLDPENEYARLIEIDSRHN